MFRAISLGVRERTEPSTSAIIRSTKVWPGSAVIRTTIRSDSTRVPPVTDDRSPPDSRTTGADSPVIAASSTLATPSTISPSPGMMSPVSQTTRSPWCSSEAGTDCSTPPTSRRATAVSRPARSEAAWALPRPSATESARLAKSTVSHNHTVTATAKPEWSVTHSAVVRVAPISTTNITGLCHITRGSRALSAFGRAANRLTGRNTPAPTRWSVADEVSGSRTMVMPVLQQSVPAPAPEVGQRGDQHDDPEQDRDELEPMGGQGPGVIGPKPCRPSDPASARISAMGTNRPSSITTPKAML